MLRKKSSFKIKMFPCPICNLGIAPYQASAFSIIGNRWSGNYRGEQVYCGEHFVRLFLPKIGLCLKDIKYLHDSILEKIPTLNHVLHYALARAIEREKYYGPFDSDNNQENKSEATAETSHPPIKSFTIQAEKNIPGLNLTLVVSAINSPREKIKLSPNEKDFVKNMVGPRAVVDFSNQLGINLDITKAFTWADYFNKTQPPGKEVHYYIPQLLNPEVSVKSILRFVS